MSLDGLATSRAFESKTVYSDQVGNPAMFWCMAYKISDALMTLSDLGVLDRLSQAPTSVDELAIELKWPVGPLSLLFDLLVSVRVLECIDKVFFVPSATKAVLPVMKMESQVRKWHERNQSLQTMVTSGVAADPLEQIEDVDFLENYQRAMAASSRALALHIFRFAGVSPRGKFLDIGGADGALAEQMAGFMGDADFCIVDRSPVEIHFERRMTTLRNRDRFKFIAEDITQPKKLMVELSVADTVIISNVLHLLSSKKVRELLETIQLNMKQGGRLVIYDQFLDPSQFSAANLMVIDWINLGAEFNLTDSDMSKIITDIGFAEVTSMRFPLIPGAIVCATISKGKC